MENYTEWKMRCRKRMKKGVVPHKFECQEGRKRTVPQPERPAALKRRGQQLVAECLEPVPSTSAAAAVQEEEIRSQSEISEEPLNKTIGVQVHIKRTIRSKAIQCNISIPTVCQSCSPMSIKKKDVAPIKPYSLRKKLFVSSESSETVSSDSSSSSHSQQHTTETEESTEYEDIDV